jgi:hypothetical protein
MIGAIVLWLAATVPPNSMREVGAVIDVAVEKRG